MIRMDNLDETISLSAFLQNLCREKLTRGNLEIRRQRARIDDGHAQTQECEPERRIFDATIRQNSCNVRTCGDSTQR